MPGGISDSQSIRKHCLADRLETAALRTPVALDKPTQTIRWPIALQIQLCAEFPTLTAEKSIRETVRFPVNLPANYLLTDEASSLEVPEVTSEKLCGPSLGIRKLPMRSNPFSSGSLALLSVVFLIHVHNSN